MNPKLATLIALGAGAFIGSGTPVGAGVRRAAKRPENRPLPRAERTEIQRWNDEVDRKNREKRERKRDAKWAKMQGR